MRNLGRFFIFSFVCLMIFLEGCSRPTPSADTLRIGIGAEPASLDPHLAQGMAELRVLSALYEGLVLPWPKGDEPVSPGVAESYEENPDGLVFTFHLRPNAQWSNGEALTTDDFLWSYERALTPSIAAPNAGMFDIIKGARAFREGKGRWEDVGLRAAAAHTLVITLERPSSVFLQTLTHPIFYPVYRPLVEKMGAATTRGVNWITPGELVSNGAFTLTKHLPYQHISVEKNKNYRSDKSPQISRIRFYPIDNRSSEEMAFLSGLVDITMALPLTKVSAYRNDPRLRVDPALQVGYLVLNTRREPLNRVEVRRALSEALNRKSLCSKILRGGQSPAYQFVPPDLALSNLVDNDESKNDLMDDAPLPEGTKLKENAQEAKAQIEKLPEAVRAQIGELVLSFNTSEARKLISEALQAQWIRNLGVSIGLENMEWKTFLSSRLNGSYQIAQAGWSADLADPANFLELFASDNPNNVTGWQNTAYDTALKNREFAKAEDILLSELPCIPLFFQPNVYLISPRVHGWDANPMDLHDYRAISLR